MDCIIGVDMGTTSTKAIAFDRKGEVVSQFQQGYPISYPEPGHAEQDPDEILRAVVSTVRSVTDELKAKGASVVGLSFSSAIHSLIAVDKAGNPLTPILIWADTRSQEYAERIRKSAAGHEIYLRTGTPIHPMSPLCKVAWLNEHQPGIFQKTHKFISSKEYLFLRFFGQYWVDYSIASATGLFDTQHLIWSNLALEAAGIAADRLSEPVAPTFQAKGLLGDWPAQLGLDKDTPFVIGASDGCLANLSANALRPGRVSLTIGTSGALRVTTTTPAHDAKERVFSYLLTEKRFVIGGAVNNGGVVMRWFRDTFSQTELAEAAKNDRDPYDLLMEKASTIAAGADQLLFLPYLLGERAPHWDAQAKGAFIGLTINHSQAHLLRAVMEGIIFGLRTVGDALEETTTPIDVIYAGGGFARSDVWVQIVADIFNKPVRVSESVESSALGAAAMGFWSLGIFPNLESIETWLPNSREFTPNAAHHAVYKAMYPIFAGLYSKLKDDFAALDALKMDRI